MSPEAIAFGRETKAQLQKMHSFACDNCKLFKKHMKQIDLLKRYETKQNQLRKDTTPD